MDTVTSKMKCCIYMLVAVGCVMFISSYIHNGYISHTMTAMTVMTTSTTHKPAPPVFRHWKKLVWQNVNLTADDILRNHQGRKKNDGHWGGTKDPIELYAYSAFYDDRASLDTLPVLRVIVVTEATDSQVLHCVLYYEDLKKLKLVMAHKLGIGFGVQRHGKKFREFVLTCPLTNMDIPKNVSLITRLSSKPDWSIPVEVPARPEHQHAFAVCISVCYGKNWDLYKLVEWMELVKILGVEKVGIYNNTLDLKTAQLFEYYQRQGLVDFRQSWNFIPDPGVVTSHLHWSPVINDCIYRNLYSATNILVMDLDEVILPKTVYNYNQLLKQIDLNQTGTTHPARSYTFRNDYFFYDIPHEDSTMPKYVKMLQHRWRLEPSPQGYSSKSIISPLSCTHMHNHYCWGYTKLYSTPGHHIEVQPKYAVNQHYKKCHFNEDECKTMMLNVTRDDIMLKYKDQLIANVDENLRNLKLTTF